MNWLIAITVDSVLRDESLESPISTGAKLYDALAEAYRVVLINDSGVNHKWFAVNGFTKHHTVIDRRPEDPQDPAIRRIRQIERMRASGLAPDLLIEPNPLVVAAIIQMGVPTLHYVDPPFGRPEFHPEAKELVTPWNQMVEELDRLRTVRALDRRLDESYE